MFCPDCSPVQAADETTPMQCLYSAWWVSGTYEVWEMYFAVKIHMDQSTLLSHYVTPGYAVKMRVRNTLYSLWKHMHGHVYCIYGMFISYCHIFKGALCSTEEKFTLKSKKRSITD